ncbi:uncharacterized protein E0L32_008595 [Thyridium curvatum]|uniref:Acyclic terpene utilisation N-terminal domain-containing protein n=1 Tax=Thyridium curvatum TaxID=1093900 RepID=A0A507AUI5_9PEZI|nr:uncharacterized protein E0L32_008595 [Thyridium curvatum]TPX10376.1 hypothetical protein E0L32_008595 [Thyridium curvatum]
MTDRPENLVELAETGDVDFIVGDWMSEYYMAIRGKMVATRAQVNQVDAFEEQFVHSIVDALPFIESRGIKISQSRGLTATKYSSKCKSRLGRATSSAISPTGQLFKDWDCSPIYSAQCYLGSWGIIETFNEGADIVVCGRVADAAPRSPPQPIDVDGRETLFRSSHTASSRVISSNVLTMSPVEIASLLERQLREYLDVHPFSLLKFTLTGPANPNPSSQDAATVEFRIFAQSDSEDALSKKNSLDRCFNIIKCTYPGATFAVDTRQGVPKPYNEYFVTIIPQNLLSHTAHIPAKSLLKKIPTPTTTAEYLYEQEVDETAEPVSLQSFGPTCTAPLGYVVHARSGDKSSDCNVGFYVRHADEYPWLRTVLSFSFKTASTE